jgi:5-hydroxyisourate hydrolase-like protein (transthyretin family)
MVRSTFLRLTVLLAGFGLAVSSLGVQSQSDSSHRGRKYKAPPATARIEVTILKDVNGKPVENAAVIFHPMEGEKDKGNMELKTNEDGKTIIEVLPMGDTVRMQVIAKGFQTFGDDYKIDKAEMTIEIRMKRPGEQYSIYKKHPETQEGGKDPAPQKAPDSSAPPK